MEVGANGIPMAVSDSLSVGTGWTQLLGFHSQKGSFVYLYNASTGETQTHRIESSLQLSGPIMNDFQEAGWTGMLMIQTEMP